MIQKATTFTFSSYRYDPAGQTAYFIYTVTMDNGERKEFQEKLFFPTPVPRNHTIVAELFDACLYNLHLILGISYWKLYCPSTITLSTRPLSAPQARFWNTVYTKGLGEFFFKNSIDFKNLVQFPSDSSAQPVSSPQSLSSRSLVGIGGGKDSIVAVEKLKAQGKPITGFVVEGENSSEIISMVADLAHIQVISAVRTLDQQIFELNKTDTVYNGHIPISAVYAFVGLFMAIVYDYDSVVVGNERSADSGNVNYLGESINHQWSKSSEFEDLFQQYTKNFITPSVSYSSALRKESELSVVSTFTKYKQYFSAFSSCNRNFAITKTASRKWCGECPKCAFVFAALAAFLPKIEVTAIFNKDLFAEKSLVPLFRQLAGIAESKPFECVGTFEETKLALYLAFQKKEYGGEPVMAMFEQEILPGIGDGEKLKREVLSSP